MNILEKIIQRKKIEVADAKERVSVAELESMPLFSRTPYQLADFVFDPNRNGIISEFKRASPSKGVINDHSNIVDIVTAYAANGVSAISVLTDRDFFGGSLQDLSIARQHVSIPLLRKEFIIDEFQIIEAKAYGADIILLIASCLTPREIIQLSTIAKTLDLNVLLEVHNEKELSDNLIDTVDAIGVNNRNLNDFTVSVDHSLNLVNQIPDQYIKISESGISEVNTIKELKTAGFNAFLIGENFMKSKDPQLAIADFTKRLSS
ncbi:indole-3-glycerol phosphate synthase TrpC [Albibacterium profundi]|uniref:Indole-3-glycerol phosphate synthase n=1 Tax=Albibacterium profundi TaxID=3134906 RepID=A0ABV5CD31_9SPHI